MRLFVRHHSRYCWSEPQARLVQLLRMTPADHHGQSVVHWNISVDRDARLRPAADGYGNRATMLYIDGPIDHIDLEVTGEVLTEDRAGLVQGAPDPLPPAYFLQSTPATRVDEAVRALAEPVAFGGDPLGQAHGLAEAVDGHIRRVPTAIGRPHDAISVAADGRADPQGAAHLLIAVARARGVPARYVAGHVYRPEAEDGHAAHGWAELHVADYGWVGFDPYERCCPTDRYVRVGVGLDHREAAPLSGLRTGGGAERLEVDVHVGPEPAQ